jgi:hypothetical protein
MDELFILFLFFIFIFSCHIVIHRLLNFWSVRSVHTILCYPIGFVLLIFIGRAGLLTYPIASLFVYVLLSTGMSILYMSFFLGAQTPAAIILRAFSIHRTLTKQKIISLFSRQHIFEKRIENLLRFGLIKYSKRTYIVTTRGQFVVNILFVYQRIFNRPLGG